MRSEDYKELVQRRSRRKAMKEKFFTICKVATTVLVLVLGLLAALDWSTQPTTRPADTAQQGSSLVRFSK